MRTRAGDVLAPLEIEITRTLVVAGAIASRDYQDVHHDPELARWRGSPDVFMNILTTNGLVGRYVTDHFGSAAVLRKVAIRLGAPNYPGDTMVLTGTVETADGRTVTVRIIGENGIGRHVTGTVTVTLPDVDVDVDVDVDAEAHAQAQGAASSSVEDAVGSVPARTTGDVE
ncbi:MaoC/PaaZ C-terminal domain-containing protein [Streptomyces europaeiscabiei]